MVLGMSLGTYTVLHVLISLIGIGSGLVVMAGFWSRKRYDSLTLLFLITTILTSLSGFAFPFERLLPSHILGILSLLVLAAAVPARYLYHLESSWRWVYVVGASIALYFNCFVLVAQAFLKVPVLHTVAPTGKEPPFLVAQLILLVIFVALIIGATKRFRLDPQRVIPRAA